MRAPIQKLVLLVFLAWNVKETKEQEKDVYKKNFYFEIKESSISHCLSHGHRLYAVRLFPPTQRPD